MSGHKRARPPTPLFCGKATATQMHPSLLRHEASNLIAGAFCKPEGFVRANTNPLGRFAGSWQSKFSDNPLGSDAPYHVPRILGEPERPIWPSDNAHGTTLLHGYMKLADSPLRCHASNHVARNFRKPEIAI